ncbi:MAG: response regulator [Candidatus Zixiibacteriota bacterium]|jgi:two-component system response regulator (stage 0 sporulation protein F)
MKILVVDDDPIIRKLLLEVLTNDGHQVAVAKNGLEGLNLARRQPFQLVFMDVHMPIMNGLEALISIRNLYPEMAVAMMDSYPDQLVRQAESKGALTCMHKPFDLNEIREVIEEVGSSNLKEKRTLC